MVYNNLVTVTYFLWSSDFGLYLQGYVTVLIRLGLLVQNDAGSHGLGKFGLYLQGYFYGPVILAYIFKTV